MVLHHGPILIGLGCSTAASAAEIIALIETCLTRSGAVIGQVQALASHRRKLGDPALLGAARHFQLPLYFLDDDALAPNVPGVCEAVAAAAGPLLLAKQKSDYATCAIAICAADFSLAGFGQPSSSSAAMASSSVATSVAGP